MSRRQAALFAALAFCAGCRGGGGAPGVPKEPIVRSSIAKDESAPFPERVRTIYNFRPARISEADQTIKSDEMDALWASAEKAPATTLPLLRAELRRPGQNPFFLYDGSMLLLTHSKAPEDLQLAADSIGRSELDDIRPFEYFKSTHRLAVQGANVWSCVDRILGEPLIKVFIPQHALTLNQINVVIYCLMPMKEDLYVGPVAARLKNESEPVAVASLLAGLSIAVTEEAQAALREYVRSTPNEKFRRLAETLVLQPAKNPAPSDKDRELLYVFLKDLVERRTQNPAYSFDSYRKKAVLLVKREDLPKIREIRRAHAARVSDEAIAEIELLTDLMKAALVAPD